MAVTQPQQAVPRAGAGPRAARAYLRPLLLVCLLALVVRLIVVFATPHFTPVADSQEYDYNAVTLVTQHSFGVSFATFHGGPTAYHPPLFSIALAGVYELSGHHSQKDRWEAGRIAEAVMGALAIALLYLIALELWTPTVAVLAAGLGAIYPPLVLVGSSLMSESLFIPLELAAVLCALYARGTRTTDTTGGAGRWAWPLAAGALAGLAALTRETGLPLLVVLLFLVWWQRPRWSWRALRAPALTLLAAILVLIPWTIRNQSTFHTFEPVTTGTGYALDGAYDHQAQSSTRFPALWQAPIAATGQILKQDPDANEAEISKRLTTRAKHYIEHHPWSVPRTMWWSTLRLLDLTGTGLEHYLAPYEGYPPGLAVISVFAFWAAALLALGGAFTAAARRAPWSFWVCPLIMFLSCVPFEGDTRYRSPVDPFLLLLAAFALQSLWARAPEDWQRRLARPVRVVLGPGAAA